jgi:nitrogen regulatory protein PII
MKKIEAVIAPWALDTFKEAAPRLGITEFELVEVYRSGCETFDRRKGLYRGQEFTSDFSARLRIEFIMFDDDVQAAVHQLLELVHPESISVFRVDQEVRTIFSITPRLKAPGPLRLTSTASAPILGLASKRNTPFPV